MDVAENTPGNRPSLFTPLEGHIYANCQGSLCRWSGTGFEPATEQERQRFDGTSRLSPEIDTTVNGWTKRGVASGPANAYARLTADVGGRFTLLEKSDPIGRTGYAAVSIYAQRPGQTPEKIWYLDGHPRRVSKAEYDLTFRRRSSIADPTTRLSWEIRDTDALAGNYTYVSKDAASRTTDHNLDHLVLQSDGKYDLVEG
jgi:hypothetical protein